MREERRQERRREIEAVACGLLETAGYAGTSMLAVAKAAGASNETLYRWYGDKKGLFRAVAEANAESIRTRLDAALDGGAPMAALAEIAVPLLAMLTGPRAVALNRAAAADASGELGAAIAQGGRSTVLPRVAAIIAAAMEARQVVAADPEAGAELFLRLLIGDWQIRRVTGAMEPPGAAQLAVRAREALAAFRRLTDPACGPLTF